MVQKIRLILLINNTLRSLAHIINLATQALIGAYSKSKHYKPAEPEAHVPPTDFLEGLHDEVGLVQAISVKVYNLTLTKRKDLFKD